ncbi:MAG: PIG-L family deacetylase [Ktedonobacteraceae bacterium]
MQLTNVDEITTKYRHIFLAPHFDDVVYSCGGTLGVQVSSGLRPLVITLFGGIPAPEFVPGSFATQVARRWSTGSTTDIGELVKERRKEDSTALDYLQADYLWLDYPEAIFRGNPAYYASEAQMIGGEVHAEDQDIDKKLAQLLVDLQARLPDTAWYAPLGVGRHVDHQIACSAADRLVQRGAKVYFYEDFPYVQRDPQALQARIQELGGAYEYALVEVSEMLPLKIEAADMYATQIISNFASKEAMHKAFEDYAKNIRPVETVRLERYWMAR